MAKFHGCVGYSVQTESAPGVWTNVIEEHDYFGDILRTSRQLREGENLRSDITVGNSISIVADAFAVAHFFAIEYVEWSGALWIVEDVTVQAPRLILRLGGVYNGRRGKPAAAAPASPEPS